MRRGGHPILGAIVGFFLFLFIAIHLVLFGVISTYSNVVSILAIAGIVVGFLWGWRAPFRRDRVVETRSSTSPCRRHPPTPWSKPPHPHPEPLRPFHPLRVKRSRWHHFPSSED